MVFSEKSFSRASDRLHITQPTVSAHIKTLESELDCKLFDRLGHSILPTKEAFLLYPLAQQVILALQHLEEEMTQAKEKASGDILFGASTIPGTYILPQLLARFRQLHPEVRYEMRINDSAGIVDQIRGHDLLLGIVGAKNDDDQLLSERLFGDELILVATPDIHESFAQRPVGKIMMTLPLLIREQGSGTRKAMEQYLFSLKLPIDRLNIVATLGSTAAIKQALLSGLGASLLSKLAVQAELGSGLLQEIPLPGLPLRRSFYLVSHRKRALPLPYRLLREYLLLETPL